MSDSKLKIAFFGTPEIAVYALAELKKNGLSPSLVVTNPDALVGRKQIITAPPVKVWAKEESLLVIQPESIADELKETLPEIINTQWDLFIVVAYGKIIPYWLLSLPKYGIINMHPSLLPKLRGASPIRSTLLTDLSASGVTIMLMDDEVDHGPILAQRPYKITEPIPGRELDVILAKEGGKLLCETIQTWIIDESSSFDFQDDTQATFCKKITKGMGEVTIDPRNLPKGNEAYEIYRKICAFDGWPGTFFFYNNKRIKIIKANIANGGNLEIQSVIPEGKKEMNFEVFLKNSH